MKKSDMKNSSETNWDMIDAMTDDQIDRSELPPLDDTFFERASWRMPDKPISVTIQLNPELLAWFQSLGDDYEQRMVAALRIYAAAHQKLESTPTLVIGELDS